MDLMFIGNELKSDSMAESSQICDDILSGVSHGFDSTLPQECVHLWP